MQIELDKIYNMDCLEGMKQIPDGSVDLIVTSPPYDNLRTYDGCGNEWCFDKFKDIAKQIGRVLKDGGVCVWVVSDATIKGSETGTSFRQALYFKDECGLNIHDTMIWAKDGGGAIGSNLCYTQNFEYMFVFSKGKPKTVNLIYDVPNRKYGQTTIGTRRNADGSFKHDVVYSENQYSRRNNWWRIVPNKTPGTGFHPATFPDKIASDHIYTWSNEGDVVLDPFMGSGTTAISAWKYKRHFIGFELNKEYYDKACKRIRNEQRQLRLF